LQPNWTSIIPPLLAIILAFITREAVFSLAIACMAGVLIMGQGIVGFPAVMRNLSDRHGISREKLEYICDSTSAPLVVLMPIGGWAVYLSSLTIGACRNHRYGIGYAIFVAGLCR
jgi:Na+/H+ antiporter NhaC